MPRHEIAQERPKRAALRRSLLHRTDQAVLFGLDFFRHAYRREQRQPQVDVKILQPCFRHRRLVGINVTAPVPRCSECQHSIIGGKRDSAGDAAKCELDLVGNYVDVRRGDALIGNMGSVDFGALLEHLSGQMRRGADAGRSEVSLPGFALP